MRTVLICSLWLISVTATAQTTTTVYDLDTGRITSQQTRDSGMIYIQRGNRAVLQTFPPDYYYGRGYYGHRSHYYYYGRAYRGYYRGN